MDLPPIEEVHLMKVVKVPLHYFRTPTDIARGVEGLDVQGFTYIDH